jgi:septal ring factor EnvC (AmiA/AmiB activator)
LRGYGNFVIINHGDRYYSTYGGLGKMSVGTNEYVLAGTTLAQAGKEGLVKFELRHGREPLDPVKWIRIDSF